MRQIKCEHCGQMQWGSLVCNLCGEIVVLLEGEEWPRKIDIPSRPYDKITLPNETSSDE